MKQKAKIRELARQGGTGAQLVLVIVGFVFWLDRFTSKPSRGGACEGRCACFKASHADGIREELGIKEGRVCPLKEAKANGISMTFNLWFYSIVPRDCG